MTGLGTRVASFGGPQLAMATGPFMNDGGPLLLALGNVEDPESGSRWGIWARAYGAAGDRDGDDIASKYDYNIYGTILGLDWKVSEKFFLGLSGSYTDTHLDFDELTDKGEVNSYQSALYGSYSSGPWYVDGLFSYARNRYDTSRGILFGSINRTAKGDYDGDEVSGYLEGGYRFKYRGFDVQPLASLQVIYLSQESYTEKDAGALNLVVDEEDTTSLVGTLGVRVAKEFDMSKGVKVIPEVRARWAYEFSNEDYLVNARFEGSTTGSFRVEGDKPNRNSGLLGLGFTIRAHKNFNFSVDYDADVSGDRTVQALRAGVTFTW